MKLLTVVFFSALCTQSFANEEMAKVLHDRCLEKSQVDPELVTKLQHREFTDCPLLKLYMKCIFDELDLLNPDNTINMERMVTLAGDSNRHLYEEGVYACGTQPGADVYEIIYNTEACYAEKLGPVFYFV